MNAAGSVRPRKVVSRRGVATFLWDEGLAIDANVQLAEAEVVDVLEIAGQQQKIPVTGMIAMDAHAAGTLDSLHGSGQVSLKDGVAYGEPYESAVAELAMQGKDVEASRVVLKLHGMQIAGNGGYDMGSQHLHGHLEGHNLVLSKFETVKRSNVNADGTLDIVADANGTVAEPNIKANAKLAEANIRDRLSAMSSLKCTARARLCT